MSLLGILVYHKQRKVDIAKIDEKELLLLYILPFINELVVTINASKRRQGNLQYEMAGTCKESTKMWKKPEKKIERPTKNDEAEIV